MSKKQLGKRASDVKEAAYALCFACGVLYGARVFLSNQQGKYADRGLPAPLIST